MSRCPHRIHPPLLATLGRNCSALLTLVAGCQGDPFWIVFGFWQSVEKALILEERAAPSAPAPAVAAPAPSVAITPVFTAGESGIACWRIPALIDATPHNATPHKGAARGERGQRLLAFAEARIADCDDKTGKMMAMKRSVSAASTLPVAQSRQPAGLIGTHTHPIAANLPCLNRRRFGLGTDGRRG